MYLKELVLVISHSNDDIVKAKLKRGKKKIDEINPGHSGKCNIPNAGTLTVDSRLGGNISWV